MNISDEAVEAAARGMFAEEQCDKLQKLNIEANWVGRLNDEDRAEYRALARAALQAAAPHMDEEDQLRRIPTYPNCATCDGGGCGDCL